MLQLAACLPFMCEEHGFDVTKQYSRMLPKYFDLTSMIGCVRLHAAPAAPTVGCLEAENAIGCFRSAGLQAAVGDAGAA